MRVACGTILAKEEFTEAMTTTADEMEVNKEDSFVYCDCDAL